MGESTEVLHEGSWSRAHYDIEGKWSIVREGNGLYVELDDNFRTTKGPDVKIFLSPILSFDLRDDNADQGALEVGALNGSIGAQRLKIPNGTDLSKYQSIIIHSQQFRVLWGEASLL